tara:strand:+ start:2196 stop:2498 length:303 start_codon:yes stop_codon:yes gene_type:complete
MKKLVSANTRLCKSITFDNCNDHFTSIMANAREISKILEQRSANVGDCERLLSQREKIVIAREGNLRKVRSELTDCSKHILLRETISDMREGLLDIRERN